MKIIKITILLLLISFNSLSQNESILYIVDAVPILSDPDKGDDELQQEDIESLTVITNKEEIKKYTTKKFDKVISITTKLYFQRSEEIKAIPTTKLMDMKNGKWYLNDKPYSGKFINYYNSYNSGRLKGDGALQNGKLFGKRKMYYTNGNISFEREYKNGISDGEEKEFYKDGTLKQQGTFLNEKEVGVWTMYHPNGQLKQKAFFNNSGKMEGEVIAYYSTGTIKGISNYKNGEYIKDKKVKKLYNYYNQSQDLYKQGNYKSSIKKLNKAIELDATWAMAYFARGTMKLNDFQFDAAIIDFDKTLQIEPYYTNAYSNRAFALIRKHQFANSRTLSESEGVQIMASSESEIPESALPSICSDLEKAVSLGDDNSMVLDAIETHCKKP